MFESTNPQNISVFFNCIFNVFERKLIMLYFENLGTTYNPSITNGLKEHYLGTYFIIKLSFDLMITFVLHNNQQQ